MVLAVNKEKYFYLIWLLLFIKVGIKPGPIDFSRRSIQYTSTPKFLIKMNSGHDEQDSFTAGASRDGNGFRDGRNYRNERSYENVRENSIPTWQSRARETLRILKNTQDTVESDGTLHTKIADAPGQSCKYIISGFHNNESYRLATFSQFPPNVPIKVADLAEAGFYYTGFGDRAKCFSCGMAAENWMAGDCGLDQKWHKTDCKIKNGNEITNIGIPTPNFRSLLRQYIGNHERTQGINSLILGNRNYAPAQTSNGNMNVTGMTPHMGGFEIEENYPRLVFANIINREHENYLKSINLKSESERRKTFTKWPTFPAPLLPSELAKQGFFYLGNLDRTQCFSCSGVLRNWAPTDNVIEQHEKHFPDCRIVRRLPIGNIPMSENERRDADETDRIRLAQLTPSSPVEPPDPSPEQLQILAQHYPCRRPVNPHMRSYESRLASFSQNWPNRIRSTPEQIAKAGFFYLGDGDRTKCFYCNGGLQNWEENDEAWTEHAKWFPGCEFVLKMKGNEFVIRIGDQHPNLNRPTIRNAVPYDIPPPQPLSHSSIVQGQPNSIPVKKPLISNNAGSSSPVTTSLPSEEMMKNLREIEELDICRNCKKKKAEMVLLPCGHLCACEECAKSTKICFVCNKRVKETLKAYRA